MKKDNIPFYKKAWFWVLVVAVCTLIYIISPKQDHENNNMYIDSGLDAVDAENSEAPSAVQYGLTKNDIENECQDAKYGVNKGYDPIAISNYNFEMYEYAYDKDGNDIYVATWNGKDKNTKQQVKFQCYVSGKDAQNVTVYWISAGGNDIWKGQGDLNYASYNKDGSPMYPEMH